MKIYKIKNIIIKNYINYLSKKYNNLLKIDVEKEIENNINIHLINKEASSLKNNVLNHLNKKETIDKL